MTTFSSSSSGLRFNPKPVGAYSVRFSDVQESMERCFGIVITNSQILEVFKANRNLIQELTLVGEWEKGCSVAFASALGRWLGMVGEWPTGEDSQNYSYAYFKAFEIHAKQRGLRLSPTFTEDKT